MSSTTEITGALGVEDSQRTERFGLRLTPYELAQIRLGADAKKMSVSAFMIHASLSMVDAAIADERHTTVSKAVFDRLMAEVDDETPDAEVVDTIARLLKGNQKVALPE